ncbi:class I SAM-dependent methyltransferase [Alphaproteobacteria bacterium]|nr:class I SAM-dependent methyltransferase [Alphaproteobacteria bacterium]
MTTIFQTLVQLGLTSKQSRVLYNNRTRDVENLKIWKDSISGVIYITDFYTGDEIYVDGGYKDDQSFELKTGRPDFERTKDNQRRFKSYLKFVAGKKIADFGCEYGDFLKSVKPFCESVIGIELEQKLVDELNTVGVSCTNNLESIDDGSLDVIVSFHVFEHLPNPLDTLALLKRKVVSGGIVLIEVPHANDFLLTAVACEEFKQFTLWSQHLVLHTRESLRKMLEFVGLKEIQIEGVQRYPLSNHLHWLAEGKAGGHKSSLSSLDTDILFDAYQNSLARIDATDTLVAIAKVP